MKAYVVTTLGIPVEIPDKFSILGGWEPKSDSRDLKNDCWEEAFKALETVLKKIGAEQEDYDCIAILDENGFTLAD